MRLYRIDVKRHQKPDIWAQPRWRGLDFDAAASGLTDYWLQFLALLINALINKAYVLKKYLFESK
ncbi:MAG: hypothetical protein EAZ37_01685 [Burkholderiales bacterium]|nr:MAG: hypothetical protein EAZ43_16750 [Betaproteobacteria bacterium]TAG28409.1 MAG: hypothetical protein EAZ37_01685 [Burkholderiales bacterium]